MYPAPSFYLGKSAHPSNSIIIIIIGMNYNRGLPCVQEPILSLGCSFAAPAEIYPSLFSERLSHLLAHYFPVPPPLVAKGFHCLVAAGFLGRYSIPPSFQVCTLYRCLALCF